MPDTDTKTNSNFINDDQQIALDLASDIVRAVLGVEIDQIDPEHREETVQKCIDLFTDFVLNYVEEKFGKKDALRLQAAQSQNGQKTFQTFEDLGDKLEEAFKAFVDFTQEPTEILA